MAINPSTLVKYNGQTAAPSSDFPYGSAIDDAVPGDLTGTPRVDSEINDQFGVNQAILLDAEIVPSGTPDTAQNSQYLQGMKKIFVSRIENSTDILTSSRKKIKIYQSDYYDSDQRLNSGAKWLFTGNNIPGSAGTFDRSNGKIYDANGDEYAFPHSSLDISQFGAKGGGSDDSAIISDAALFATDSLRISFSAITLSTDVDCQKLKIICNNTVITPKPTLINHNGIERGLVSSVSTSDRILHQTPTLAFNKPKILRKFSANEYRAYTVANNGRGYVETTWRDDIVDVGPGPNSIGGVNTAFRITKNRNVNSLAMLLTTIDSRTLPGSDVVRTFGGGTGGEDITYYRTAKNGTIDFDVGSVPISILSVAALITTSGADSVEVTSVTTGQILATINLVGSVEAQTDIKIPVQNLTGVVRFTNNDTGTNNAIIAGVNFWDLNEDNPQGDVDSLVYSFNVEDYSINQGANDFALARFNDLTGGSFHGGETVNSDTFTVDGVTETLNIGDILYGNEIRHTTNVTITWPSDSATVTVSRIEYIGDGMLRQLKEMSLGSLLFESIWTCMFETNPNLTTTRLVERKGDGVGTSPLHETYERSNAVQQDIGLTTVVTNYFTVFDNETNSNGGPYIIDNAPTSRKLYYGPVLFNKRPGGSIVAEQITVFGG